LFDAGDVEAGAVTAWKVADLIGQTINGQTIGGQTIEKMKAGDRLLPDLSVPGKPERYIVFKTLFSRHRFQDTRGSGGGLLGEPRVVEDLQ
jgi:hypothetical protein